MGFRNIQPAQVKIATPQKEVSHDGEPRYARSTCQVQALLRQLARGFQLTPDRMEHPVRTLVTMIIALQPGKMVFNPLIDMVYLAVKMRHFQLGFQVHFKIQIGFQTIFG